MTEVTEKVGIKESLELMEALKVVAVAMGKIAQDKRVAVDDLTHLLALGQKLEVIIQGAQGLDKLDEEWKDLDQAEALQMLSKTWEVVRATKNAYQGK